MLDPTALYRLRDGAYATDLIIAAVCDDLFAWLARHGPVPAAGLREAMGWAERPADVLLTLCAAHGLVDRFVEADDLVSVSDLARWHLTHETSFDLRPYFGSLAERPAVAEFAEVLRTDRPAAWASAAGERDWSGRLDDPRFAQRITAAMDARGAFLAPSVARALHDLPIERLLDVGGSSGIYAMALLEDRPAATATVVERPPVDEAARTLLAERGAGGRIDVVTANMFADPWPPGCDVHLLSQVLHDWDLARVERLVQRSFDALAPGGRLVDVDAHVDGRRTGPRPVAEYSALLMHSTPGKCWSVTELADVARRAGFAGVEVRDCAADRSALVFTKPA
ncbi:O-methyltransferase [Actinomycetospora succinea]|uniref:O-methyltransferase n=1 Tax=Actinomycetospora succinea TaxID=663603 RepID=A0A4R6VMF8_9PSEU|nr:methyltransferase [Actinomycetospora succinea]TDQ65123.1 O-methyltransferase [Actinomycetospora succinea]